MTANPNMAYDVREALRRRGRTIVRVQGRSMFPVLRHGSRVEVQPVAYDELRTGDLVVFTDGRGLVCHRLLRKTHRVCHCKGDTNLWADPPVVWSQILGRVSRIVDADCRIRPIDTPHHRRRAALVARLSYPYALYYNTLHSLGQCRWWSRSIHFDRPEESD